MNRLYLAGGLFLAFAIAIAGVVHEHDVRIRSEERQQLAQHRVDSLDAILVPLEHALADTIAALHRVSSRDSAAAAAAVTEWARVAHPPKVVVRIDTLPGRIDTVFREGAPSLPAVIVAGDAAAEKCTAAVLSCAQRAVALERDTTLKARRIAELEGARAAVAPPRSCTVPTIAGAAVGGVLGGVTGYLVGKAGHP